MQAVTPALFGQVLFGLLLRSVFKRKKKELELPKPAPLAERGTQLPMLIGRHKVGPAFTWEGVREVTLESGSVAGGKGVGAGGAGLSNEVYFANGAHFLCVGPGHRLRSITKNGEILWPKPGEHLNGITPQSAPNGTSFTTADDPNGRSQGEFEIYWGEVDQSYCVDMCNRTGVWTRWPFTMWIYWKRARLGGAGTWPNLDYDIEVRPYIPSNVAGTNYDSLTPVLAGSDPWLTNGTQLSLNPADAKPILEYIDINLPSEPRAQIWVGGNQTSLFVAPNSFELRDSRAGLDGQYRILETLWEPGITINPPASAWSPLIIDWTINTWNLTTAAAFRFTNNLPPGMTSNANAARWQVGPTGGAASWEVSWSPEDDPGHGQPTNGTPGDFNDFGTDYHSLTIYVDSSQLNAPTGSAAFYKIGFRNAAGSVRSEITMRRGATSNTLVWDTATNGIQVQEFSRLGTSPWFRVSVMLRLAPGGSFGYAPTDQMFWSLRGEQSGGAPIMNVGLSDVGAGLVPFVRRSLLGVPITGITRIYIAESVAGGVPYVGTATPYVASANGMAGANAAHIIRQLLMETDPHGLGLSEASFDIPSLEAVGTALDAAGEGLRSHVDVSQRTTVKQVLADLLADVGIDMAWDVTIGKFVFKLRREEAPFAKVPREMLVEDLPHRVKKLESDPAKVIAFLFQRADDNYTQDSIEYDDLGNILLTTRAGAETTNLNTVRDRETAARIAIWRGAYELARTSLVEMRLKNDALTLRAGDVLDISLITGIDLPFRVVSIEFQPKSMVARVTGYYDVMNVDAAVAELRQLGVGHVSPRTPDAPLEDFAVATLQEPDGRYIFLRIPSQPDANKAALMVSSDGLSYWTLGLVPACAGGWLLEDFGVTGDVEDGFLFQAPSGPYASVLPQLPAGSVVEGVLRGLTEGREVFYFRELEALGGDTWRVKGLVRAQDSTSEAALVAGQKLWVWMNGTIPTFEKNLPTTGTPSYKLVPISSRRMADPSSISADTIVP